MIRSLFPVLRGGREISQLRVILGGSAHRAELEALRANLQLAVESVDRRLAGMPEKHAA